MSSYEVEEKDSTEATTKRLLGENESPKLFGIMSICPTNEEIVVTGISGRYPESDSVEEFEYNLYKNIDMVTSEERRWPKGYLGIPTGKGHLKEVDKFDAEFFEVSEWEANYMDPQLKIATELTYEAIWDSGTDPNSLSGSNTGVFIGYCFEEYEMAYTDRAKVVGYKQFFTQKISNKFNLRGPSKSFDAACASSCLALHEAVVSLRTKQCDNAIVVGANICLNPMVHYRFFKIGTTSPDGHCKCLDESANGYAKGEACVVIFLQQKSNAKRIYATIVHTKTNNDGYKEIGITYPSWELQRNVMRETYTEARIDPLQVKYIEAHCTGTQAGDPQEMRAICESMCIGRKDPLLIGALKSNIGHTEGASGLCSLTKVILSFENQCIPANLHFKNPNPNIEGLMNGMLKPINENTPFTGDLVGVNNFGFGGSNVHVIVKSPNKAPMTDNQKVVDKIPRLVHMCGRNEETLNCFFKSLFDNPSKLTRDLLSLLNDISKTSPFQLNTGFKGMRYRGFSIIENSDQNSLITTTIETKKVSKNKKQVWFMFSGIGSQWSSVTEPLMNIDIFAKSIKKSAQVLNEYGIDLLNLLLENNQNVIESPLNSLITITTIQIALVDLLYELGIRPDGIIGHSIGEWICAYADNCITAEETILIAYYTVKCIQQYKKATGMMAEVDLSWDQITKRYIEDVYPACYNSENCITISGEQDIIDSVINQLNAEDITTRKVNSFGVAFHTPIIGSIAEILLNKFKKIIKSIRLRSSKWINTSYNSRESKYVSPEYFVDNLIFPAFLDDCLKKIPENCIVIEMFGHNMLHSFMERRLDSDANLITLMDKNNDNLKQLLTSVGNLYTLGLNPSIEKLYPGVEYPVSTGTRSISSLIKWDHAKSYTVAQYPDFYNISDHDKLTVEVDLRDEKELYLSGHRIDGRILFPATGYLSLAWKLLARINGVSYEELPVEFRNVSLNRATILSNTGSKKFTTKINEKNGEFVIYESGANVCDGKIFALKDKPLLKHEHILNENQPYDELKSENIILETKDIYKEFRLRGYDYEESFQCITNAFRDNRKMRARVKWTDNWVTFADSILQISILGITSRAFRLPVRLDCLRCDPRVLIEEAKQLGENPEFECIFDYDLNIGVSKGIEYHGVEASLAQRNLSSQKPTLGNYRFIAHNEVVTYSNQSNLLDYLKGCDKLALKVAEKYRIPTDFFRKNNKRVEILKNCNEIKAFDDIEDNYLYRFLKDLAEFDGEDISSLENSKSMFSTKLLTIDKDFLIESFNDEQLLKLQLLTVIENKSKNHINFLEVNHSSAIMHFNIMDLIEPNLVDEQINYSLLHPNPNEVSAELKQNLQIKEWITEKSRLPPDMNDIDLIIYKDTSVCQLSSKCCIDLKLLFESVWNTLKPMGFLLIICRDNLTFAEQVICKLLDLTYYESRTNQIIETVKTGFHLISTKTDPLHANALLFRKLSYDIQVDKQIFFHISNDFESWIERLQTELKLVERKPEGENLWLIANDEPINGILGFFKSLSREPNGNKIRCIFNFDRNINENLLDFTNNNKFLETIIKRDLNMNVLYDNKLGSFKLYSIDSYPKPVMTEHCFLNIITRGDLSSFKWLESEHKYWPNGRKEGEKIYYITYASLNFRDVMLATGKLSADTLSDYMGSQNCILGIEFSGIDENGNRVMGICPSKCLATTIIIKNSQLLFSVPKNWSLEDAATVPAVYATAYYALIIRGNLKPREKVLIHSGSGGVGQAAISICLSLDCYLFITVGSNEKREFLKELFPRLTDRNLCSSRDLSFKTHIMSETNGLGVDVILNSLSEEKLQASLECLANNGRFLEIGKYDLEKNSILNVSHLLRNKTFHGIFLDALVTITDNSSPLIIRQRKMIKDMIEEGIKNGIVRPLNRTVFDINQCEKAFRFMASGKHIGKVLIKIRDPQNDNSLTRQFKMLAIPRTAFYPNKSYIITGGLGGMGLELANWMIERGAKILILTSRNGPKEPYQHSRLKYFNELGINVKISTEDLSTLKGTKSLLEEASSLGPIGGIFHLSLVLSDALFENQTIESFKKVFDPKSSALINLDSVTRGTYHNIDYFVAFSSIVSFRGNAGQTNYGFTNSVMERICDLRRLDGLHGLAIQWGVVGDVGYIVNNILEYEDIVTGTESQRMYSCLAVLDRFLLSEYSICSSFMRSKSKYRFIGSKQDLMMTVTHILGIEDYKNLDLNKKLVDLGIDSLMAVEIKQIIERDFDLILNTQEIRNLTIANIKEINSGNYSSSGNIQISRFDSTFQIPTESMTYLNSISEGEPIFYIPPNGGTYDLFKPIAKSLNRTVIGLNWTRECNRLETMEAIAEHYLVMIKEKFPNIDSNYKLIGYSVGGVIAYEMGTQLKNKLGFDPKIIVLDSSPIHSKMNQMETVNFYLSISIDIHISNDDDFHAASLVTFLMDKLNVDLHKVYDILRNTPKDRRVEKVSKMFLDLSGLKYDLECVKFAIESYAHNSFNLFKYSTDSAKFNGNLLLIRSKDNILRDRNQEHTMKYDYGFNEIVSGKCDVIVLDGDHQTFMANNVKEIVKSINNYFEIN